MLDSRSSFFTGVVTSSDAATFTTQIETFGGDLKSPMQGIPLAGVFATALGFKECGQYSVGTWVLCYAISYDTCYIIGIIPDADYASPEFASRACLKTADGNFDQQNSQGYNEFSTKKAIYNQNRPTDVVDGEYVVANEFGVLLGLFQQMATLKASELAQIQCFLLDDMVRIISHNYEHLTALGDFKIFHDGKAIMAEFGATGDPRESMGVPQVTGENNKPAFVTEGPPSEGGTDETDFYKIQGDDRTKAIERLKVFLGKVGDFIHIFLVRPDPDAIRTLSGELGGKYDTGMADMHVGLDGRISIRTVTGAAIEKTNWIMVPHRVRSAEDPKGDSTDDITFEDKDPFKFDDSKKVRENPTMYALQMRDCNAYLQDFYNYKNFLKYKKDFKLSENSQGDETKLKDIKKVDPHTAVNLNNYQLRRSGLYLMDNGGWMLKDAWGSAIVSEGGDIYIQPAKDLVAQPLRNYIAKAGQFVSIAARKDIDLSSTEEGFRLKTLKTQHFYSSDQGIILHSNSYDDTEPSPDGKAYKEFGGILFKANKGIYSYGEKIFDRAEKDALYKADHLMLESIDKKLNLKGKQIEIVATDTLNMVSKGNMYILPKGNLTCVSAGDASFAGKNTNFGNKGVVIGMAPHPGSMPAVLDGVVPIDAITAITDSILSANEDYQQQMSPFQDDDNFTKLKFHFLASSDYNLNTSEDFIPQTIAQQDDAAFNFLNLTEWSEKEINSSLPFPGKDKFESYYVKCDLKNLQKIEKDVYSKNSESLKNQGGTLKDESLKTYKVVK